MHTHRKIARENSTQREREREKQTDIHTCHMQLATAAATPTDSTGLIRSLS